MKDDNPLRSQAFRRLFTARAASVIGSSMTPVAVSLGVLQATGSAADVGVVLAAYAAATLTMVLIGGVLGDRLRRDRLMLTCDLVRTVTQVLFGAAFIFDQVHIPLLAALQIVNGVAAALYGPATVGLTADTAAPELRQRANALLAMARDIANTAGPMVATTAVLTIGAGWALLADAATFALSAFFLSRLEIPDRAVRAKESFIRQFAGGWQAITTQSWIWSSILGYLLFNVTFSALLVLGPATLVGREHGLLGWGAVMSAMAVGELAGSLLALRYQPRRKLAVSKWVMALIAPLPLAIAYDSPVVILLASAALAGVAMTFPDALWLTVLQNHVPEDRVSRVMSFDWCGSIVLRPVALASSAGVAAVIGMTQTLVALAVIGIVGALGSGALPCVRRLGADSTPPAKDVSVL